MLVAIIRQNRMCKLTNLELNNYDYTNMDDSTQMSTNTEFQCYFVCTSIRIEIWFIQTQKFKFID